MTKKKRVYKIYSLCTSIMIHREKNSSFFVRIDEGRVLFLVLKFYKSKLIKVHHWPQHRALLKLSGDKTL